jgi:hypothetical protein
MKPVEFVERADDLQKDMSNCLWNGDITMPFDLDIVSSV